MNCLFADETKQDNYIFGVAIAGNNDIPKLRQRLRNLVLPGQRSLHFANESLSRRAMLLDQIVQFPISLAVIDTQERRQDLGRQVGLLALIRLAEISGVSMIVLEKDETTRNADSKALRPFIDSSGCGNRRFEILARHEEPMLWIPDAIAWSYQKGGDFRKKLVSSGLLIISH